MNVRGPQQLLEKATEDFIVSSLGRGSRKTHCRPTARLLASTWSPRIEVNRDAHHAAIQQQPSRSAAPRQIPQQTWNMERQ
jgi:hypothetical protein